MDLNYNAVGSSTWSTNGWTDIFENADSVNCPVTSCVLRENTCTSANTYIQLSIAGSSPWIVTLVHSNVQGYNYKKFCYYCYGSGFSKG